MGWQIHSRSLHNYGTCTCVWETNHAVFNKLLNKTSTDCEKFSEANIYIGWYNRVNREAMTLGTIVREDVTLSGSVM